MSTILPRVFVGSSTEAEVFARAMRGALKDVADVVTWRDAPEFEPTHSTLTDLQHAALNYDFGVFILAPDDVTVSRGEKTKSTRDNVLFELGLFLGSLGPDRAIAVIQKSIGRRGKVKVPSDLLGINMPAFPYPEGKLNKNLSLAEAQNLIEGAAKKIHVAIEKHKVKLDIDILRSFGFRDRETAFAYTINGEKLARYFWKFKERKLLVVARKDSKDGLAERDTQIAKSRLHDIPVHIGQDIDIKAKMDSVLSMAKPGDMIEGYLMLVPKDAEAAKADTLAELFEMGCLIICRRGYQVQGV